MERRLWTGRWVAVAVVAGLALGALMFTTSYDARVSTFWIYSDHFPTIEHINWIIYFTSLAMIQQLPFLVAASTRSRVRQERTPGARAQFPNQ